MPALARWALEETCGTWCRVVTWCTSVKPQSFHCLIWKLGGIITLLQCLPDHCLGATTNMPKKTKAHAKDLMEFIGIIRSNMKQWYNILNVYVVLIHLEPVWAANLFNQDTCHLGSSYNKAVIEKAADIQLQRSLEHFKYLQSFYFLLTGVNGSRDVLRSDLVDGRFGGQIRWVHRRCQPSNPLGCCALA